MERTRFYQSNLRPGEKWASFTDSFDFTLVLLYTWYNITLEASAWTNSLPATTQARLSFF